MDLSLYEWLNGASFHHDGLEDWLRFFAKDGQFFFVVLLAGLFLVYGKWASRNGRHGVVAAGFSASLALLVAQAISHLWDRPRPYEAHPGHSHLFVAPSPDGSFPSDHATASFAIAVAIFLRHRRAGAVALTLAVLVSVGRVAVGTHYPTDILGGAALGTAAALFFWMPQIRRPLHALANRAGALYERVARAVAGLAPGTRSA
jgi:undecaprenyl-diphosphatase